MNLFKRRKNLGESRLTTLLWQFTGSAILNLVIFLLLAVYLSPLAYVVVNTVKTPKQLADSSAPLYPATNPEYKYNGIDYPVLSVPTANGVKEWAIITKRRTYAEFIDPQNPSAGLIHWDGNWYGLKKVYRPSLSWEGFANLRDNLSFFYSPTLNTLIIALISEIGVLLSSIAVAYGFSRFRIPGGKWLFLLLISTILIPDTITLIPTYMTYLKLIKWLNTTSVPLPFSVPWGWVPLIAPYFFSSAAFVFLLRQNFKSIPRDLDEAAMLDGAGPLRILTSVILPQSIPVVATVALLHFFYIWNELRNASLYISLSPDARPTISFFNSVSDGLGISPDAAATVLLVLVVPVVILFLFQRFFMQDMVVTGLEK
jgi:multiple sugar transport system permease protein